MRPPAPVLVEERFAPSLRPGGKPTHIDLHYKVGAENCGRCSKASAGRQARCGARSRPARWRAAGWVPRCPAAQPQRGRSECWRVCSGAAGLLPTFPAPPLQAGKTTDWEREAFDYVKYSKMSFSSAVIGPVAVAALFRCE